MNWRTKHNIKWFFLRPIYRVNSFFRRIKYVCSWLPFLWKDINWDWTAIFYALEFKLRFMEKAIRNGHHTDCEKDADNILECAALCRRLSGDYDEYERVEFRPVLKQWTVGYFCHRPEPYEIEFFAPAYENYMFLQDLDRLCLLLRKHVRCWWE